VRADIRSRNETAATSVLSDDPVMADMAATALMVAGPAGFEQTARRMGMGCALLVTRDGVIHMTPAMRARRSWSRACQSPTSGRRLRLIAGVPRWIDSCPPNERMRHANDRSAAAS